MREDVYYGIPENIVDTHCWEFRDDHLCWTRNEWMCRRCGMNREGVGMNRFEYHSSTNMNTTSFPPPCKVLPHGCYVVKILTCKRCMNVI